MNRPSYKELWLYEHKDREEQLQWIRDAVDGNAKFRNSEPPYSEEEELARKIMQMHARIAELEKALNIDTDLTIAGLRKELRDATTRIAELEAMVEQLIWAGNDLLIDNANPVTVVLFNGLVAKAKEKERER